MLPKKENNLLFIPKLLLIMENSPDLDMELKTINNIQISVEIIITINLIIESKEYLFFEYKPKKNKPNDDSINIIKKNKIE